MSTKKQFAYHSIEVDNEDRPTIIKEIYIIKEK